MPVLYYSEVSITGLLINLRTVQKLSLHGRNLYTSNVKFKINSYSKKSDAHKCEIVKKSG